MKRPKSCKTIAECTL